VLFSDTAWICATVSAAAVLSPADSSQVRFIVTALNAPDDTLVVFVTAVCTYWTEHPIWSTTWNLFTRAALVAFAVHVTVELLVSANETLSSPPNAPPLWDCPFETRYVCAVVTVGERVTVPVVPAPKV
jgi:hypothetical protein